MKLSARPLVDIGDHNATQRRCGSGPLDVVEGSRNKINKQGYLWEAVHTYRHDLLLVRAAMLVRRFPLTQRGRLWDISVRVNGG